MACCGLSCEYIYSKLDSAEDKKETMSYRLSRNLLSREDDLKILPQKGINGEVKEVSA